MTALVALLLLAGAPAHAAVSGAAPGDGAPLSALPDSLVTRPVAVQAMSGLPRSPLILDERIGGMPEAACPTAPQIAVDNTADALYADSIPQFKVVYARASDQPDRFDALKDKLQANVSLLSRFMAGQSNATKTIRFDLGVGNGCSDAYADIASITLPGTRDSYIAGGAPQFADIAAAVRAALPLAVSSKQNLIVYADGLRGTDGIGGEGEMSTQPGADQPGAGNPHNDGRLVGVVYGAATVPTGTYADPAVMMHAMGHNLGAVALSAPHSTGAGHCRDEQDVMCYADGGPTSTPLTYTCPLRTGAAVGEVFDCGRDDYFNPAPGAGSFFDTHWNVYDAAQLAPCGEAELQGACGMPDTTRPVDTSAVLSTPASSGWFTSVPVNVRLDGTDSGSGVVAIQYYLDAGALQTVPPGTDLPISSPGQHLLTHYAVDAEGNTSLPVTETIRVDALPPTNTTPAILSAWRNTDLTVPVSGTDATSGVKRLEWQVDGGAVQTNPPSTPSLTVTGDGTHTVKTRVVDNAGLDSGWRTDTVRIDTVLPVDETSASGGWRASNPVTVSVKGSDTISSVEKVEWILDGVHGEAPGSISDVTVSGQGEHTLVTQVTDAAGNASGWTEHIVRIDTTAPSNSTPVSSAAWRNGPYSVVLGGNDGESGLLRMEWSVDGEPARSGPAGTTVTVTGTQAHTLRTRTVDRAGNYSAWRTDPVNIDTVLPVDATAAVPSPTTPVADPYRLSIVGTDDHAGIDHVEWKIDGGATQSGASGAEAMVTGDGLHTLAHRVVDRAGNATDWRSSSLLIDGSLTTDSIAPTDRTIVPTGWQTGDVEVTLQGVDDDAGRGMARMEWRKDGGAITSAAVGGVLTFTGDGTHRIETRAVDKATPVANRSGWLARTIRIDTTVPIDETVVPSGWRADPTFTVGGRDVTSGIDYIEWQVDSGPVEQDPPGTAVPVADGIHTVTHRAVDQAGQASAWVQETLKVDTVAPANTTPFPPPGWQTSPWTATPSGTDAGSGIDRVEWRIDGGDVQTGDIDVDDDGTHTVETRAVDKAGNATSWRSDDVRVDLHAPADTTTAAPAGWRREPWTVTPSASDELGIGVDTVEYKVGEGGTPTSGDITVSAEGVTTVFTRATDLLGQVSDWRPHTIRIDSIAPTVALSCGDGAWKRTPVTCTTAANGGPSGVATLTFTRAGAAQALTPGAPVTVSADGAWPVTLRAVDGAGNAAQAAATVRVDTTPPSPALSCAPAATPTGWSCRASATDAASGVASVRWRVDGGAWQALGAGGMFSVAHGRVEVEATDAVGLRTASAATVLADRSVPPTASGQVRTRTRSVPVTLAGTRGEDGLLGAFELRAVAGASSRTAVTADVRPLVVGAGRFRVTLRLTSGQLTAQRVRVVRFRRGGTTPRMGVSLSGVRKTMHARLTVERRARGRWKRIASASTSMRP